MCGSLIGGCLFLILIEVCRGGKFSVVARERIGFTFNEKVEIMRQLNQYRRSMGASNMDQMFWHYGLQKLAQSWANNCDYKHNRERHRIPDFEYEFVGENLYLTTLWISADDAHKEWYAEKDNFFPNGTCMKGFPCGHYAQMMWYNTESVGCGLKYCDETTPINKGFYVVCDYGPLGNTPGKPIFLKGEACSQCADKQICKDKLCAPPNCNDVKCQNGGVRIEDVCMCNCTGTGYDGEFCETGSGKDGDKPIEENSGSFITTSIIKISLFSFTIFYFMTPQY